MTKVSYLHTTTDDLWLKAILFYLSTESVDAVRQITHARVLSPPLFFGNPTFSGDTSLEDIVTFLRVSPRLHLGYQDERFQLSWDVPDELSTYAQVPDLQPKGGERETLFSIQACPFSYRRFTVDTPQGSYSLRTFSPQHPPRRSVDTLFGGIPLLDTLEPALVEREIVRSFVIHEVLYQKGLPFHNEPSALVECMSADSEDFYNGQMHVEPFTPLDIAVTTRKKRETMRFGFLTPEAIETIATRRGVTPAQYLTNALETIGRFLHELNFFEDDVALLSCTAVSKTWYQQFFGEVFGSSSSGGEYNPHNISVDLITGDLALVDDFSSVFPITTRKGEHYLSSTITPYRVKISSVSEEEMQKARNASLIYFIQSACSCRPLVRWMYKTGLISEQEYRAHITLLDDQADIRTQRMQEGLPTREILHIVDAVKDLVLDLSPYATLTPLDVGGFRVYITDEVKKDNYENEKRLLSRFGEKDLDAFVAREKTARDPTNIIQRYETLYAAIRQFCSVEWNNERNDRLIHQIEDGDRRLASGKVARTLYETLQGAVAR